VAKQAIGDDAQRLLAKWASADVVVDAAASQVGWQAALASNYLAW